MNQLLKYILVVLFLALGCELTTAQDDAQSPTVADVAKAGREQRAHKVSAAITQMQSPVRSVRETGLQDLLEILFHDSQDSNGLADGLKSFFARNPEIADVVRTGLIQSLVDENRRIWDLKSSARNPGVTPTPEPESAEAEGTEDDFYPTVIELVAALDDERAIPALVGAIPTGGMAQGGLLKYGQKALNPVLEQLSNPDPLMRSEALAFGVTILLKENDPAARARITELVQSGLRDQEFLVRMAAIRSIERIDDRDSFVPELRELAEHDPLNIPESGAADDYPVRREAIRALHMIANHEWRGKDAGPSSNSGDVVPVESH